MPISPSLANATNQRVDNIITAARARARDTKQLHASLLADRERLLSRGLSIMLSDDYAAREVWLNEYHAICRRMHDLDAELGAAA